MSANVQAIVKLGDKAPNFEQESTDGKINFYGWAGDHWVILFSHSGDFTPVCTTEIGVMAQLKVEFEKRNVKVLGLSLDSVSDHKKWVQDIEDMHDCRVSFPILADVDRKVSNLYGLLHPETSGGFTVRTVLVIDHEKEVRLIMNYPTSTGRNFEEILRAIDSLQLTDNYRVATPVNWEFGDDVIILPAIQEKGELSELFPKGYKEVKPYLRITPQPNRR